MAFNSFRHYEKTPPAKRPPPGPGADGTRVPARILNGEVVQQWLNMEGNYARGMEFTVEIGVSKSL